MLCNFQQTYTQSLSVESVSVGLDFTKRLRQQLRQISHQSLHVAVNYNTALVTKALARRPKTWNFIHYLLLTNLDFLTSYCIAIMTRFNFMCVTRKPPKKNSSHNLYLISWCVEVDPKKSEDRQIACNPKTDSTNTVGRTTAFYKCRIAIHYPT